MNKFKNNINLTKFCNAMYNDYITNQQYKC